jgi:hypothetical protein
MILAAALLATWLTAGAPTPLGEPELAAVLRDAYHAEAGADVPRPLLVAAWGHVAMETGRSLAGERPMVTSRGYNLGSVGAAAGPHHYVAGHRHRTGVDHVDAARAYWRALLPCSGAVRAMLDGSAVATAGALAACGYHRTEVEAYARALRALSGTAERAVAVCEGSAGDVVEGAER